MNLTFPVLNYTSKSERNNRILKQQREAELASVLDRDRGLAYDLREHDLIESAFTAQDITDDERKRRVLETLQRIARPSQVSRIFEKIITNGLERVFLLGALRYNQLGVLSAFRDLTEDEVMGVAREGLRLARKGEASEIDEEKTMSEAMSEAIASDPVKPIALPANIPSRVKIQRPKRPVGRPRRLSRQPEKSAFTPTLLSSQRSKLRPVPLREKPETKEEFPELANIIRARRRFISDDDVDEKMEGSGIRRRLGLDCPITVRGGILAGLNTKWL